MSLVKMMAETETFLRTVPLICDMTQQERVQMSAAMQTKTFEKNQTIIQELVLEHRPPHGEAVSHSDPVHICSDKRSYHSEMQIWKRGEIKEILDSVEK